MKKLIAAAILFSALFAGAQTASADVYVNGYRNQNGPGQDSQETDNLE